MLKEFKSWMERSLEKPFLEAEIIRADILRETGRPSPGQPKKKLKPKAVQV